MSNYYEIVAAFAVALTITLFFSGVLRHKGPWGASWLIFTTIFLASWAGYLWIIPFGPLVLGVSVAPILIVGIIFAFILAAVSVPQPRFRRNELVETAETAPVSIGLFFWIVVLILIVAIISGYYRHPINSEQVIQ